MIGRPINSLCGFDRSNLTPGERQINDTQSDRAITRLSEMCLALYAALQAGTSGVGYAAAPVPNRAHPSSTHVSLHPRGLMFLAVLIAIGLVIDRLGLTVGALAVVAHVVMSAGIAVSQRGDR
jgi:hypothetical protein